MATKKASPAARKAARTSYKNTAAKSKPGSGARFKALTRSAKAGGAENPEAVAAAAGRRKYGAKRMASMAAAGRRKNR